MKTRGFKIRKTFMAEMFLGLALFAFAQYIQPAKAAQCDAECHEREELAKKSIAEQKRANDLEERRIRQERYDSRSLRSRENRR